MSPSPPFEIDRRALETLKRSFLEINRLRLEQVRETLRLDQRLFLDLLPLLFHVNHPDLPGYVDDEVPFGLTGYQPGPETLRAVRQLAHRFEYKRKGLRSYPIHSILAMGSAGSVAFSEKSDFDMWLCYEPGMEQGQIDRLQGKCTAIEEWADSLGLEAHFFLMDADAFRGGSQVALSSESSGSAQHHFLLDEFYRTMLLVGGRYPVWWLVPAEHEREYDAYVAALRDGGVIHATETIDFGGLGGIPAAEFYGASVWQLYKGIGSPYKSVLKILLMEVYTQGFPDIELLAVSFKRRVAEEGSTDPLELDPYLALNRRLEEYLQGTGDEERLALMRRSFYFKVDEQLSRPNRRPENQWRYDALTRLVTEEWGWDKAHLYLMDARPSWKAERVMEERLSLLSALKRSYQALSDFAKAQAARNMINPRDLNILGRKLYAAFERKAGKIDLINPGISKDLSEEQLTFYPMATEQATWMLYRGDQKEPEARKRATPLKRARSLIELIAWAHFNGVLGPATMVQAYARDKRIDRLQVVEAVQGFQRRFPDAALPAPEMEELERPARIRSAALFVNAGSPDAGLPLSAAQVAQGGDVFCYGGGGRNLVQGVDLVAVTSWKEILTYHFDGDAAVLGALGEYLTLAGGEEPPQVKCDCLASPQASLISRRVEELFTSITKEYRQRPAGAALRYVIRLGAGIHLLEAGGGVAAQTHSFANREQLMQHLELPLERFTATRIHPRGLGDSPLPLLFDANRPEVVQFFYQPAGNVADIFILDENGSLFRQRCDFHDGYALLSQFHRFFSAVLPRRGLEFAEQPLGGEEEVEYFLLERNERGGWGLVRHSRDDAERGRHYFNVQVIGEAGQGGRNLFTIYCNDREFSSLEHGAQLFHEIAASVMEKRQSGQRYPIYITDIDISRMQSRNGTIPTIQFLNYKKRIEQYLNDALQKI